MKYLLLITLLVVVVITAGCISGNQNNPVTPAQISSDTNKLTQKPSSVFTSDVKSGSAPLIVNFRDIAANAETYLWDFGDGSTSTLTNPSHIYQNEGIYSVAHTATNSAGSDVTTYNAFIIVTSNLTQVKNRAQIISYDDLFRYNEKYVGDTVYFRGKIVQISLKSVGSNDEYFMRVATKKSEYFGYSDDIIYVDYKGTRYLEGDIIDLWGSVHGLETYTAVLGNEVTIPSIKASLTELVMKASESDITATTTVVAKSSSPFQTSDKIITKPLEDVNSDLRYNQISDFTTDGTLLKNAVDKEYAKFDANDEYAKYLFQVSQLGKDLNTWGQAWHDNEKAVALAYADNSIRDLDEMSLAILKMKSSDKYSSFSQDLGDKQVLFDDMKYNLRRSKDYTSTYLR